MIPIIWRFLLTQYLKVTFLSVAAFILVLLTARMEDIVHFASLGAPVTLIFQFILFQIPYILPIAIPVGCLIASFLLMQRLSQSYELTAMRACGLAIRNILMPIFITAAFLSVMNFYIVSELATSSHFYASYWKEELRSINPLFLLKNKHLMKMKGGYFEIMGTSQIGKTAEKALLALPNQKTGRISILLASELSSYSSEEENKGLEGKGVTLIAATASPNLPDSLVIEQSQETALPSQDLSKLLQQNNWVIQNDHLPLPLLLARLEKEKKDLVTSQKSVKKIYSEIIRRVSVALAVFTLTFLGLAFGISISRSPSPLKLLSIIVLAALYLSAYFFAKGGDHTLIVAASLYLLPHFIILCSSLWVLRKAAYGVDK